MSDSQLDALAVRVVDKLEGRETAKANENPNEYILDAFKSLERKDEERGKTLGLSAGPEEEWE